MTLKLLDVLVVTTLMAAFQDVCSGKKSVTYFFPADSCNSDPYVVDENTMVYMRFEGDLGSQDCRQMLFTTPKSAFYRYKLCMKELYYNSPKCQSMVYFSEYWSNSYDNYDYYSNQITGEGCKGNSYGTDRIFSKCEYDDNYVSFEIKKHKRRRDDGYNNYDRKPVQIIPDKLNDTFKFQIETKWEYNYDVLGGIAGGIVGLFVLTGVGIYLCICCRRRKRLTGKYCCACPTYRPENSKAIVEGLSQGFSAECAVAGILMCSCVLCRRQQRNESMHGPDPCEEVSMKNDDNRADLEKKWESLGSFKDPDTVPLIQCDN